MTVARHPDLIPGRQTLNVGGEKVLASEIVKDNLQLPNGCYDLDFQCSETGHYEWELEIEDDVARFLGVHIKKDHAQRTVKMTQKSLI